MSLKAVYTDTDDLDPAPGIEVLRAAGFEVIRLETHDSELIVEAASDADALLLGYAALTEPMLARMNKLQIISLLSTGSDNVDLPAATAKGVCVANIGATSAQEVATHALALTLSLARGLDIYRQAADRREWFKTPYPHVPPRLSTRHLGLLGFGNIGRRFAAMAKPLFGSISFYDPTIALGEVIDGAISTSLESVVSESDFISLHMPLTSQTKHLLLRSTFGLMKKGVVLINVSRGGLIDSAALLEALDSGILSAAGLDVLESEPPDYNDPTLSHPKILVTPHVAYLSDYSIEAYIKVQASNVLQWFGGEEVSNSINGIRSKQ